MIFDWLRKKNPHPLTIPEWESYRKSFGKDSGWSKKTPLEEISFVVFDTETTGLDHKNDRILSIGAVRVLAGTIDLAESLELFVKQEGGQGTDSIPIHGILPARAQWGTPEPEALGRFLEYIGNSVLVGHHVGFDLAIVNQSLYRQGAGRLKNRQLDTRDLALRVEHVLKTRFYRPEDYTLDALCERFRIEASDRHTASGDAFITALLLLKLLHRLKKRGVSNWKELFRVL